MAKNKRKLTPAEKAEKAKRRLLYKWIFINGKQVMVKREPTIDGLSMDEFIRLNADPIWLHQNEMWEYITPEPGEDDFLETEIFEETEEKKVLNELFKDD